MEPRAHASEKNRKFPKSQHAVKSEIGIWRRRAGATSAPTAVRVENVTARIVPHAR
jgi:hypothetical protein